MNQAILYGRLGRLMKRRADCLEEIERLRAIENNDSSVMDRARSAYEKTLRSIEDINAQLDAIENQNPNSEGVTIVDC